MYIRVNYLRKNQFFDIKVAESQSQDMKRGDFVILKIKDKDVTREEVGMIVFMHDFETIENNPPTLVRKATEEDIKKINLIKEEQKSAFSFFVKSIEKHKLDMRPVAVYFSFDGKYADFLFQAEERIDFRELVKEVAGKYKKKIFLEQIGPRDRASLTDSCGTCGRKTCCSTWLQDRVPVSMSSVRSQNLFFKDRDKLTGLCGKLKCCLNYELDLYNELAKAFPNMFSDVTIVSTGQQGTIIGRSILEQMVRIGFNDDMTPPATVPLSDVKIIKQGPSRDKKKEPELKERPAMAKAK